MTTILPLILRAHNRGVRAISLLTLSMVYHVPRRRELFYVLNWRELIMVGAC